MMIWCNMTFQSTMEIKVNRIKKEKKKKMFTVSPVEIKCAILGVIFTYFWLLNSIFFGSFVQSLL